MFAFECVFFVHLFEDWDNRMILQKMFTTGNVIIVDVHATR